MNAIDEYDIRDTFQALDSDQDGFLTLDEFHTLYLGLGYRPQRISQQELQQLVLECNSDGTRTNNDQGGSISLGVVLQVLKKVCVLFHTGIIFVHDDDISSPHGLLHSFIPHPT